MQYRHAKYHDTMLYQLDDRKALVMLLLLAPELPPRASPQCCLPPGVQPLYICHITTLVYFYHWLPVPAHIHF